MKQSVAGIVYQNGLFLIGLRIPGGEMGNRWEFPGGKVDAGEDPVNSLKREFLEEMNVDIIVHELITTTEFTNKNGNSLLLAYNVDLLHPNLKIGAEHQSIKWVSFNELQRLPFVCSDTLLFPFIKEWMQR